jgi:hypothetical protein
MDALMQALMGGDALTDDDKLKATANSLRNANNAANLFSLSTVAPIANAAKARRSNIMDAATRAGRARQIGLEKAANRKMKEDELKRQEAIRASDLAREQKWREEDRQRQLKDDAAKFAQQEYIQNLKNQGKAASEQVIPMTKKGWSDFAKKVDEDTGMMSTIDQMLASNDLSTLDPTEEYRYTHGKAADFVGAGLDDAAKDRQRNWANYRRYMETPERHKFYGGALTAPEIKEYQRIKIQPGMQDDEIKIRLKAMKNLMLRAAARGYNKLYLSQNPEQLRDQYAGMIDNFIFDDKGKVAGLNIDTDNTKLIEQLDEYRPNIEKQRENITPEALRKPRVLKKSLGGTLPDGTLRPQEPAPEQQSVLAQAPDRQQDPDRFMTYLDSLEGAALAKAMAEDPSLEEWVRQREGR